MRSKITTAALTLLLILAMTSSPASADPAAEVFDDKDGWICNADEGLVDNHCLNTNSSGTVGNIKVFAPDPRGPQESISFDPRVDERPCPHDAGSPDGTWWEFAPGVWVCHHSGNQP